MLFTYWHNSELVLPPSTPAWRERFPDFTVFGDEDVIPLLGSDELRELYMQIGIPACKSDIARLVLLRAYGGLYIDAHAAPAEGDRLAETLDALSFYELLLFSKAWHAKAETDFNLMNTVIAARRHAPALDTLIDAVFANLVRHRQMEREKQNYVPYHLFSLTGTMVMIDCFFAPSPNGYFIRPEFEERVHLYEMTSPTAPGFHLYQFYGYRKPGEHWSERQKHERLFRTAA